MFRMKTVLFGHVVSGTGEMLKSDPRCWFEELIHDFEGLAGAETLRSHLKTMRKNFTAVKYNYGSNHVAFL